jgi:hypothetical protein
LQAAPLLACRRFASVRWERVLSALGYKFSRGGIETAALRMAALSRSGDMK